MVNKHFCHSVIIHVTRVFSQKCLQCETSATVIFFTILHFLCFQSLRESHPKENCICLWIIYPGCKWGEISSCVSDRCMLCTCSSSREQKQYLRSASQSAVTVEWAIACLINGIYSTYKQFGIGVNYCFNTVIYVMYSNVLL